MKFLSVARLLCIGIDHLTCLKLFDWGLIGLRDGHIYVLVSRFGKGIDASQALCLAWCRCMFGAHIRFVAILMDWKLF
jgi:hypothetical protein